MSIVGARPNFIKMSPVIKEIEKRNLEHKLVHTGQHYDEKMSEAFIRDLGLPAPHVHLGIGSGTHAEQTGGVMIAYEKICKRSIY